MRLHVLLTALALAACAETGTQVVYTQPVAVTPRATAAIRDVAPDDAQAAAFARAFLNSIQPESVARRAELCGYFYINAAGQIAATPPRVGSFAGCEMPVPQRGKGIFASYHTHSAYAPGYDNEVPSVTDMRSDFDFAIDGYVSTPGGRVWHVDYSRRTVRQVCGLRCVYMDPGFRPEGEESILPLYDMNGLRQRSRMF